MANKILEKTLGNVDKEDLKPGYAAAQPAQLNAFGQSVSPPVTASGTGVMSVSGTARSAIILFVLLAASGTWAWTIVDPSQRITVFWVGIMTGLILGLVTTFKPKVAPITAPLYAIAEGAVLGTLSRIFEEAYNGIVLQAILATGAIVFVMYTLYSTGMIKVTPSFRRTVMFATLGIFVFYMANLVFMLFGAQLPLIWDSGPAGIFFSVLVIGIAASNLALDFDFIERGAQSGLPKYMNWAAAYGLIVTIVWIYLEVLRLIAKSRS